MVNKREAFHWGSGCVSNMTWNDPGPSTIPLWQNQVADIILQRRKAVHLLYFTGSISMPRSYRHVKLL